MGDNKNKREGIDDIIRRTVKEGILSTPTGESGKQPTMSNISDTPCEEFLKHFKIFWLEPHNSTIRMKHMMLRHLREIKCEKCLKEFAKIMEAYPTEESRKNEVVRMRIEERKKEKSREDEIERMRQEKIKQEKLMFPERCNDWERHDSILNVDFKQEIANRSSPPEYDLLKFGDDKICCIYELRLIMNKLADDSPNALLNWIEVKSMCADIEYEEILMETMTDILTKKPRNEVMMAIINRFHRAKEYWEGWVESGKSYRGQSEYYWMKRCKERLSKVFGLTDDMLEIYEAARKKRLKRLAVRQKSATFKEDKHFSMPLFCDDTSRHDEEVEKIYAGRKSMGDHYAYYTDLRSSYFDALFCCKYKLSLFLKKLISDGGINRYVNDLVLVKRILDFQPKRWRMYSGIAIKILNECDYTQVMECLNVLYHEIERKIQEKEREVNWPVPEDVYSYISYLDNLNEFHVNKKCLSILKMLIKRVRI